MEVDKADATKQYTNTHNNNRDTTTTRTTNAHNTTRDKDTNNVTTTTHDQARKPNEATTK
eukprot:8007489-Prorocentrum_lima.AAC.1